MTTRSFRPRARSYRNRKVQNPISRFQAPGRVNLIGEHTDYNQGFVLPAAVGLYTQVRLESSAELVWKATSSQVSGELTFQPGTAAAATGHWYDHVLGVALALQRREIHIPGFHLFVEQSVPLGAGLSSSAALQVASAIAMLSAAGANLAPLEIAEACLEAETEFIGLRCGIMDHFVALHAKAGHTILLDCQNLEHEAIPIPPQITMVIADTGVKHELVESAYNQRQTECAQAARALGWATLREHPDLPPNDLVPTQLSRARHVISENKRVLAFATALRDSNFPALGQLMADSHESLRSDYEVSCEELDLLVELAQTLPGLIGARMTGGGFGGSTINLVHRDHATNFMHSLSERYQGATGIKPKLYLTDGAGAAAKVL